MSERIRLLVVADSGHWHLTWQDTSFPSDRHYHVDPDDLKAAGKDVRTKLQDMVDAAKNGNPLGPPMKELARAGAELRKAIFRTGPNERANAIYIKDQHLPSKQDLSLLVSLGPTIYIPWGLAYDGDPEQLPDNPQSSDITATLYSGFWCLKYRVCTLYEIMDPSGVYKPRANNEVQMLTIVNQQVWKKAEQGMPPDELAAFKASLARSGSPIASSEEFFKVYKRNYRDIDLLYVYCHANGTSLALSGEDEISVTKFGSNVYFDDREPHPPCLVFLNGCQTAIGTEKENEKGGFMKATGNTGFCGFIGTEAKVPDLFALRFGARFFYSLLYEEKTVADVMDQLRREHFPLALVYSTCCHPDFKIRRIETAPVPPPRNLSFGSVFVAREV